MDRDDSTDLPSTETSPDGSTSGQRIGPYRLLQKLGDGGMGVVYEAEQEKPIRRKVALKIIKPGMDSKQPRPSTTAIPRSPKVTIVRTTERRQWLSVKRRWRKLSST